MDRLYEILSSIRSNVDFENEVSLIDSGILDSFDIISIIAEVNDAFEIEISADDISPENFNSAKALYALIERYQNS